MFPILPVPKIFLDFHPAKFLMTFFLVVSHIFAVSVHFQAPLFAYGCWGALYKYLNTIQYNTIFPPFHENYHFLPTFANSPWYCKIYAFFTYFMCFSFTPLVWPWCIYASHNVRTGRSCMEGESPALSVSLFLCGFQQSPSMPHRQLLLN